MNDLITIISPATTMNFDKDINLENSSNPVFKEENKEIYEGDF